MQNRRDFIKFFTHSSLSLLAGAQAVSLLSGCSTSMQNNSLGAKWLPLKPSSQDSLLLAEGLSYKVLAKWQDTITNTDSSFQYGMHNDFTSYIPFNEKNPYEGYLLVNHEYLNSLFLTGWSEKDLKPKTKEQVDAEMKVVGNSILHIRKENSDWHIVKNSIYNWQINANTEIDIISQHKITENNKAFGTLANCAGGKTPWNTFLTCEENYDQFFGEWVYRYNPAKKTRNKKPVITYSDKDYGWHNYYDRTPLQYGWVVEVDPVRKKAKKLTALGRFAHEGAACINAKDNRTVVYMGDDANGQCIYKFISDKPNSLDSGTLYVADTLNGKWIALNRNNPLLKKRFIHQTELLINTREAAQLVGGTPQDRPEDIEINPLTNEIVVALTNNKSQQRPHGSLLKITEKDSNFLSLEFKAETWISGGDKNILSCPDNLVFDNAGNLWVTTDRGDSEMNKEPYLEYKNNGLYYIPTSGKNAGQIFQIASAPKDAEFTGPTFLPDGTLLLCVQHPGEQTKDLKSLTSSWPDYNGSLPKSALVAISGDLLKALSSS